MVAPEKSARETSLFPNSIMNRRAPEKSAPGICMFIQLHFSSAQSRKRAPEKSQPEKPTRLQFAPEKSAPVKSTLSKRPPERSAPERSMPERSRLATVSLRAIRSRISARGIP